MEENDIVENRGSDFEPLQQMRLVRMLEGPQVACSVEFLFIDTVSKLGRCVSAIETLTLPSS